MSLYGLVFGTQRNANLLLALLDLTRGDVGRFRDAFLCEDEGDPRIAIYTRNGGGNREDYFPNGVIDHPLYIRDEDDEFDNTYCTIYFRLPTETPQSLHEIGFPEELWPAMIVAVREAAIGYGKFDPDARWAQTLAQIEQRSITPVGKERDG